MSGTTWTANFVLSNTGTLVYVPGGVGGGLLRSLAWVTRQGREEAIKAPPRAYTLPRISPDGTRVAFDIRDQENDIWVWDLRRETLTRLTFDPGLDQAPVWTPDSRRLLFSSLRGGAQNLYAQAADNTGAITRLTNSLNPQFPSSISPDGTQVLFTETVPKTGQDISLLKLGSGPATSPQLAQPLIQTAFNELNAEVSPDGRWVAYQSNESGSMEVYVRPFPHADAGRWQVSSGGGTRPVWAHNSRELFFYSANSGALMAVTVQPGGTTFSASNPSKVFDVQPYYFATTGRSYDVSADGQRFLMIKLASLSGPQNSTTAPPNLVVVEHWTEELKARVPTK
jgi:serine/threonine-protein kinase